VAVRVEEIRVEVIHTYTPEVSGLFVARPIPVFFNHEFVAKFIKTYRSQRMHASSSSSYNGENI
jgi:hypothetical protein